MFVKTETSDRTKHSTDTSYVFTIAMILVYEFIHCKCMCVVRVCTFFYYTSYAVTPLNCTHTSMIISVNIHPFTLSIRFNTVSGIGCAVLCMNEQCIRREAVRCACMRLYLLSPLLLCLFVVSKIYAHCIYIELHTQFPRDRYIFGVLTRIHAYHCMQHSINFMCIDVFMCIYIVN